jgi:2,4-dienoyl-CoA reductase-like NADH-dependent reductase (Old Yellow Enzyme family)
MKRRVHHSIPATRWPTAEEAAAARLFSPSALRRGCAAETRTWVPAMVPWRSTDDGFVTPAVKDWYGRFAEGRPGVLVVEATGIRDVPSGPLLRIGHDRYVSGLRDLVETVRERSGGHTRLLIQVIDFLAVKRRPPADKFFRRFVRVDDALLRRLAAFTQDEGWLTRDEAEVREFLLGLPDDAHDGILDPRELESLRFGYRERVDDLDLPHVRELPDVLPGLFAQAARRASDAGFDGVELHYAHAYTMASLLSRTNQRDDGYGGSREGRVRLPLEVFERVRGAVPEEFVVGCRFLGDDVIDGGSRIDDAVYYGLRFADAGMDFLSVSKGGRFEDARQPKVGHAVYPYTGTSGHECMPTVFIDERGPFGRNVPLAAAIRGALRTAGHETPVVTAGGINSFERAESILANGEADFVAAARQSLADPDWWEKMRRGRGGEIRRCKYTNYCEALDERHKQVTCQLWDRDFAGDESATRSSDGRRRLLPPRWSR